MKPLLRACILILFVIGIKNNSVFASHVSGGDISYECTGLNQYSIILNLFRDCSGIDMSTVETITVQSSCGTQTLSATLMNPGGTEISQLCPAQQPNSTCNSGSLPGMERYTYVATATLLPCSDWTISWTTCCRNTTVNVPTSSGDGSYIEATLNSVLSPCNNSPIFTAQPIPYVCANTQVIYNWGITELDGDSLTYSLFAARSAALTDLIYSFPYTATNPINGITIDQFTGQLTFTPTTLGNFIVAILVEEWDSDGNLISETMRDIQFVVQTCSNIPPSAAQGEIDSLTGTSNQTGPYSLELCDGGYFSFNISIADVNLSDIVTLTSNISSILPGSSFIVSGTNPVNATISWAAPGGSTFFNYFTVFANDGACPVPGIQSYVYQVSVIPGTVAGPDTTILCGTQIAQIGVIGGSNFVWSVVSGDSMIVGTNFSCDSCPDPIASPAFTTIYEVVSDLTTSTCVNRDTVEVKVVQDYTYLKAQNDSTVCLGDSVQFFVFPDSTSTSYSYAWTSSNPLNNDSIFDPTATFNVPGTGTVYFSVSSLEGCVKNDSMQVSVSPGQKPIPFIVGDTSICAGDSSLLSVINGCPIPASCGLSTSICPIIPSQITVGTGTSVGATTTYPAPYGNWYMGAKHQILFTAAELNALGFSGGQIAAIALDIATISGTSVYNNFEIKMGCTSVSSLSTWETGLYTVFPAQTINIATGWNVHTFTNSFDWDGQSNIIVETCFNMQPASYTYNSPTYYTTTSFNSVIYYNADVNPTVCSSPSYVSTSMNRPNIRFTVRGGLPTTSFAYIWTPTIGLSDSTIANPWANLDTTYQVIVYDTIGGCSDSAIVSLQVVPNFNFTSSQTDTVICKGDWVQFTAVPDSSTPPYTYSWIPPVGVTLDYDSIFNPVGTFDSSGTKTVYFTIANTGGCEKNDSMTVFVGNASKPIVSVLADTTICQGDSAQISAVLSNGGPSSNYTYSWSPGTGLSDSTAANLWGTPPLDTNLYTVIVYDTVGICSDTVSLFLYVIPSFTFTTSQSDDTICMQEQVLFSANPDSSSTFSYLWTPSNILNDSATSNPIGTFYSPGTKTVYVSITNAGGCTKSDSLMVFVAAAVKPDVTITGDTAVCVGDSTLLNATINNAIPISCGLSTTGCGGSPTNITVGTGTLFGGTTSYPAPYGNFYMGVKHQLLFTQTELSALGFQGGQITSLALNVQSISGTTVYNNFEIKMGCTSLTSLTTWESGLVTVFPAQTINITAGWNTHTFTNAFDWDGTSNIIVDICFNNQPTSYTTNSPTYYTPTTFNSVIYYNADVNPTVCSAPFSAYPSTFRPNVRFSTCGSAPPSTFVYSWTPGTGLSSDTIASPWVTPPQDTTYYSVIVADPIGGCADTATVGVYGAPLFNIQATPSDTTICLNESVNYNLTTDPGTFTFDWSPATYLNDTDIANPTAGPITTGGTYFYTYTVSSTAGCDKTDTVKITVSPGDLPVVTITGSDSICEGNNTLLIASSNGGNSPTYSFDWTYGTFLNDSTISNPIATPTTSTIFTVIVTDTIGNCADTATFSVGVVPYPDVQISPPPASVCIIDNFVVLSATPSGGSWTGNGSTSNGYFSPSLAGLGSHYVTYSVQVPPSPFFGCSDKDSVLITVNPNPPVPTAYTNDPYCAFSNIDSIKANTSGGYIYWFSDSNLTDTIFIGNPMYNVSAGADTFSVWLTETSLAGCESNGASELIVQVVPNPVSQFTANPGQGYAPLSVSFANTSVPDTNDFTWLFSTLGTSTADNPSFIFDQPGSYDVVLVTTGANGCADTSMVTIVVDLDTKLIIPNIFTPDGDGKNDLFYVQYVALSEFSIVIFNRWGLKVYESSDPAQGWNGKDMQGQEASAGVYFYVIVAKDRAGNLITKDEIKGTVTLIKN